MSYVADILQYSKRYKESPTFMQWGKNMWPKENILELTPITQLTILHFMFKITFRDYIDIYILYVHIHIYMYMYMLWQVCVYRRCVQELLKETKWQGIEEDKITSSIILCAAHQMLFGWSNKEERLDGACSTCEAGESCMYGFVEESWGKESLGRPRRRWKDNKKMDLQEVGWGA